MQDRVSLYPGRVTLTPVSGQTNTYDMVRADSPTQEGTALNKASLLKDTTAALYGLTASAVPDDILNVLGKSVLAEVDEYYTKHVGTNADRAVGSTMTLNVDGVPYDFIVVHQGKPSDLYDDSCNGTWLLMKDVYTTRKWTTNTVGSYKDSAISSYLNNTFFNLLDSDIQAKVKQVKIPYVQRTSATSLNSTIHSGADGCPAKVFLLSGYEMGWTQSQVSYIPVDGASLSYFYGISVTNSKRIAYKDGVKAEYWLRSLNIEATTTPMNAITVATNGSCLWSAYNSIEYGCRPALILPSNGEYVWYTDSEGNIYTEQEVDTKITDVLGNLIQIPASQIKDGVKIATGSYTGTGTYGASNPNSLTFEFAPKLLIVSYNTMALLWTGGNQGTSLYGNTNDLRFSTSGTTVSWYSTSNAGYQNNANGVTYPYVALG